MLGANSIRRTGRRLPSAGINRAFGMLCRGPSRAVPGRGAAGMGLLAPPTYLAAPEVADYHAIALCEHVAGGDIGVFGTHIRARVIHADVGPFPIFPIRMVISAGAGLPAASWRARRTFAHSAIFSFFL